MRLSEIHDREPLVWIMVKKLLPKNHICLIVDKPMAPVEGWIDRAEFQVDSEDYEFVYHTVTGSARGTYFTTASHLESFELVQDPHVKNVWSLRGTWEMPHRARVKESTETDEAPLIYTLMKQQQEKGTPLFIQRTRGQVQAIYPITSFRFFPKNRELNISISERYVISGHGIEGQKHRIRSAMVKILDTEHAHIDDRWTLSKTKHGMVLHISTTPVSDLLDSDETR